MQKIAKFEAMLDAEDAVNQAETTIRPCRSGMIVGQGTTPTRHMTAALADARAQLDRVWATFTAQDFAAYGAYRAQALGY